VGTAKKHTGKENCDKMGSSLFSARRGIEYLDGLSDQHLSLSKRTK